MPTLAKEQKVSEIKEKFKQSKTVIVTHYRGLTANEMVELRKNLKSSDIDFDVYKNTLSQIAFSDINDENFKKILTGPTAIAFGKEDAIAPSKVLSLFAKDHPNLVICGGLTELKFIDKAAIAQLATLPTRKELLAMLVGALGGPIRKLAIVLKEIAKKQESAAGSAAENASSEEKTS